MSLEKLDNIYPSLEEAVDKLTKHLELALTPKVKVKAPYVLEKALEGDVGYDIRATKAVSIDNFSTVTVPTGVYLELPPGYEAQVRPKSGLSSRGVIVHFGTVDNLYRGEVGVNITNVNYEFDLNIVGEGIFKRVYGKPLLIKKGQKIAQLVFKKCDDIIIENVPEIDINTERGTDGFGSTGEF